MNAKTEDKVTVIIKSMKREGTAYREAETLTTRAFDGDEHLGSFKKALMWLDKKYADWNRNLDGQEMSVSQGLAFVKAIYQGKHSQKRQMVYLYY